MTVNITWNFDETEVSDDAGNVCETAYFGSREAAEAALRSLNNCKNSVNCSGCSDCSGCSRCSDCSDCSGCSRCSDCSRCSRCSGCSGCSRCSGCSDCSGCSGCSGKEIQNPTPQPTIPLIPDIHKAVFAAASDPNHFDMGAFHSPCGTTHCRAGWVIALAGADGAALESYWGSDHAAWLIYWASDPAIDRRPDFYTRNATALEDMARLAGASK